MPSVTFLDTTYNCSCAVRGDTFIHLLDADNVIVATFDGIVDFDAFSITDGDWTYAADPDSCPVAVVLEDGTIAAGGHLCKELVSGSHRSYALSSNKADWTLSGSTYSKSYYVAGLTAEDLVLVQPETQIVWARSALKIELSTNTIKFSTSILPSSACTLTVHIIKATSAN